MAVKKRSVERVVSTPHDLQKTRTGIHGLDEITGGGLPRGRPTLVCGPAGCGKTMFATEFVVRGALEQGEPGVFMMFEETAEELAENVRSLGFDLEDLQRRKKLALDFVHIERTEIEETGEYDLEGLFIRLGHAIDKVGAKRVVLDTIEALFSGLPNHAVLRAELRRLFRWLKERGVTAIITGERGEHSMTRYGLEEYVADCVIVLDHRIVDQISTRSLRVVKYRGTSHGTNEYPFLIGAQGLVVLPITSMRLDHVASTDRVSSGIRGLDEMLDGKGYFKGSSVLVSGAPGTGKSTMAATFADAACRRGERTLLFTYEESQSQLLRNMRSIGLDLAQWVRKGLLEIHASRPTLLGLEQHLVAMHEIVTRFRPAVVAVDPISNLTMEQGGVALKSTLMRLIDFLKEQGATALFTSLTADSTVPLAESQVGVSSLMDSWILLTNISGNGERTRAVQVLKSRGMPHSNRVREFVFGERGVDLIDVYFAGGEVLTGTARMAREALETASSELRDEDHSRRLSALANRRKAIDAKIAALNAEAEDHAREVAVSLARERLDAGIARNRSAVNEDRGSRRAASSSRKRAR